MTKLIIAYVAGPYRDPRGAWYIRQNIQKAEQVAAELWTLGYVVICPHTNTGLMDGLVPDDVWLAGGLELLARSDVVVLIPGWRESAGAMAEAEHSWRLGKPTYEWDPHGEAWLRPLSQGEPLQQERRSP